MMVLRSLLLFAATVAFAAADEIFYPKNHFNYVNNIADVDSLNSFVKEQIAQDKTVFVRWIASTR